MIDLLHTNGHTNLPFLSVYLFDSSYDSVTEKRFNYVIRVTKGMF